MLRVNPETFNVYAFKGEGGSITFEDLPETYGEIVLKIKGEKLIEKRSMIFGQQTCSFVLTDEDINKLGSGTHPYFVVMIDGSGQKNTIIPDLSSSFRPSFTVSEE